MQRFNKLFLMKAGSLLAVLLLLGGCVYGPDYGYVRGDGYYGDAYYGTAYSSGSAYGYYDSYYGPSYGSYYGYGPSIGLGFYYDNYRHRRYYDRGGHGGWHGGNGGWHGGGGGRDGNAGHGGGRGGPSASPGGSRASAPAAVRSAPSSSSRGSHR